MNYIVYVKNYDTQKIELYFTDIPDYHTRSVLKRNGWWWSPDNGYWCAFLSNEAERFAKSLGAVEDVRTKKRDSVKESGLNTEISAIMKAMWNPPEIKGKTIEEVNQYLGKIEGKLSRTSLSSLMFWDNGDSIEITVVGMSSCKFITIKILEDSQYQNSSENIWWIGRPEINYLIKAIINSTPWIIYNNELCYIFSYTDSIMMKKLRTHNEAFMQSDSLVDVWIYKLKMPCSSHPEYVESVTVNVCGQHTELARPINVQHCKKCRKYYINSEQYTAFAKKYGLPLLRLRSDTQEGGSFDYTNLNEESVLHYMGYNVNATDNIPATERHDILVHAIETNTLSKAEVVSFLESLLYRNEGKSKFENACSKWREDLHFTRNYKIGSQRQVNGRFRV